MNNYNSSVLLKRKNFELIQFKGYDDPSTLNEIGAARAVAFKKYLPEVTDIDLDQYDAAYEHLYVRNIENRDIVGAYRIGVGTDLFPQYGQKGFAINDSFDFESETEHILSQSLELGRSFVNPLYQKSYLPLLMLWQGINKLFYNNADLKYIIGMVSIPQFSNEKLLHHLIDFLKKYFHHQKFSIKGRIEVKTPGACEFHSFDELKPVFDSEGEKIPILVKKYLKQNAKILGYNIDEAFGNSIDALTMMSKLEAANTSRY